MIASKPSDIDALGRRIDLLESANEIRGLVHSYFDLCDRLGPNTNFSKFELLFTEDATWQGVGSRYGQAFGGHQGRGAIIAMLSRYSREPGHFTLNSHFLSGEQLRMQDDTATGEWLMLQMAAYRSGGADVRVSRVSIEFKRISSRWAISGFKTENIFGRNIDYLDDGLPPATPRQQEV